MRARKEILWGFLDDIWNQGLVEKSDDYIADVYMIENDPGDPWHGQKLDRAGFKARLVSSRAMAPDQKFSVVEMIEEGNGIALAWNWAGTHLGDIPGFPATGRHITMSGLTIYKFEGDKICGHWQVADRLSIFQQISAEGLVGLV